MPILQDIHHFIARQFMREAMNVAYDGKRSLRHTPLTAICIGLAGIDRQATAPDDSLADFCLQLKKQHKQEISAELIEQGVPPWRKDRPILSAIATGLYSDIVAGGLVAGRIYSDETMRDTFYQEAQLLTHADTIGMRKEFARHMSGLKAKYRHHFDGPSR